MKLESVWQGETKKYPGLEKDIDCDIAVIGGGIAGYKQKILENKNGKADQHGEKRTSETSVRARKLDELKRRVGV